MASSPPRPREPSSLPLPRLIEALFRAGGDEDVIFFCVEDAPRVACSTRTSPDGSLTFATHLEGDVIDAGPGELRLRHGSRRPVIRHLLPGAVDLAPLRGQRVQVSIFQRYAGRGRATIDAEITDSTSRLILWAHDGRMPSDRLGLAFRRSVDAEGDRLAVGHAGGVASVRAPDLVRVQAGADTFDLAMVRAGTDDVSFVMIRR